MRVEVSNPPPAVWVSIPGLGIGGYAKPSWLIAANGLSAEAAQSELGCFTAKALVWEEECFAGPGDGRHHLGVRVEVEDIFWVHCGEGGSLSGARAVSGVGQATAYRWLEARFIALRDAGMPPAAAARQLRLSRSRCEAWELKRRQSQILLGPLSLTAMPDQAAHLATAVFEAMMRAEVSHDGEG